MNNIIDGEIRIIIKINIGNETTSIKSEMNDGTLEQNTTMHKTQCLNI